MTGRTCWFPASILIFILAAAAIGGSRQTNAFSPLVGVTVERVSVADVTQDHVQLSLLLALVSDIDVAVRQMTFDNVRVNEVPLYVAPVDQRVVLKANQRQQISEPLRLSLYFRDLTSVQPLQFLLSERRVRMEGTIYLEAELPPLIRVLLFGTRVRVPVSFRQEVGISVPENALFQSMAAKALSLAAIVLNVTDSLREGVMKRTSSWREELWKDFAPGLLLAHVKFAVRDSQGQRMELEQTGTGYRLSPTLFVLCKGLVEPWKFDPDIAAGLRYGGLTLEQDQYDLSVWSLDALVSAATALRLSHADFRLVRQPADANATFYALQPEGRPRRIALHRRDASANLALFEFLNPPPFAATVKRPPRDGKVWDRVAIFRFPAGINEPKARADLIFVSAARTGSKITLGMPVDSSAWGSPVIAQDGVVGLLLDQTAALPFTEALDVLKLK